MGQRDTGAHTFDVTVGRRRATIRFDRDLDLSCVAAADGAVDEALAASTPSVVVDLTGARFLDSTGVSVLLRVAQATRARGGRTVVAAEAPGILRVLAMLGLDDELPVRADVAAAERLAEG